MNPLPNRPLLNNMSIPLALPNVPSFDHMAYNGRPRKVMPEAGKDFPLLNGMSMMSGPSSAPAATASGQIPPLERSNPLGSGLQQQHLQQQSSGQLSLGQSSIQPQNGGPSHQPQIQSQTSDNKDGESEPRQLTAIFRPDDAGKWKEELRLAHEESERNRLARDGQSGSGVNSWDRRRDDEDDKEEETEVEDDESTAIDQGEGAKNWKAKRTLRKSVA